jgi:hypothetical protein
VPILSPEGDKVCGGAVVPVTVPPVSEGSAKQDTGSSSEVTSR